MAMHCDQPATYRKGNVPHHRRMQINLGGSCICVRPFLVLENDDAKGRENRLPLQHRHNRQNFIVEFGRAFSTAFEREDISTLVGLNAKLIQLGGRLSST